MRGRLAIVVVSSAFAACSAFDAADPVAGPSDAGVAESGGPRDASDAGQVPASSDASDFCKDAAFCDDFERDAPQGEWPHYEANGDAVSLPVGADAPHGRQYARIFVTPKTSPPYWPHARFFRPVTPGASRVVEATFRFRAPALLASHHANLTSFTINATPPLAFVLTVQKDEVVAFVSYDNDSYTDVGRRARRVDQWDTAHVVLDLDKSIVSAELEDGAVVTSRAVTPGKDLAPTVTYELGPGYSDFETSYTLDFDALEVRTP